MSIAYYSNFSILATYNFHFNIKKRKIIMKTIQLIVCTIMLITQTFICMGQEKSAVPLNTLPSSHAQDSASSSSASIVAMDDSSNAPLIQTANKKNFDNTKCQRIKTCAVITLMIAAVSASVAVPITISSLRSRNSDNSPERCGQLPLDKKPYDITLQWLGGQQSIHRNMCRNPYFDCETEERALRKRLNKLCDPDSIQFSATQETGPCNHFTAANFTCHTPTTRNALQRLNDNVARKSARANRQR